MILKPIKILFHVEQLADKYFFKNIYKGVFTHLFFFSGKALH